MSRKTVLVSVLVVCCALSVVAVAADDTTGTPKPTAAGAPAASASAPAIPKKQNLGPWWQKNALERQPVPAQWLFHAEGTFSFMNASGNTSGNSVDLSASGVIRKNRYTSSSLVQLGWRDMAYGFTRSSVDYAERTLREQVDFAVTNRVKVVGGIEHYRNTLMYMDKRLNAYGGIGATAYRNDKHQLTFTGGAGHASFSFDPVAMSRAGVTKNHPSSGGVLGMQVWQWNASHRFSFSQDASYMEYFDAYLGHRWTVDLAGNFPISKHFAFSVAYRIKEEDNTIIEALGVRKQDRTTLIGIRASM